MSEVESAVKTAWRWPAKWSRGWARGVSTVTGILATGFAGLVIEDLFPNSAGEPPVALHTTWWRVGLLVIMIVVFCWVFWSGSWRDRTKGTLIYALFLSSGHVDRHSESAAATGHDRPVFRTLLRRFRIPTGLSADVADQVEEASDRLTELIHEDDPKTRTTLAPNMLLPIGLAIGWRLTNPNDDFRFREVDTEVEFSVTDLERAWVQPAATTAAIVDTKAQPYGPNPAENGPIWLDIYLSNVARPLATTVGSGFPVPSTRRTIGIPTTPNQDTFEIVTCGEDSGDVNPAELAVLIARAIQDEVTKKRTVILTGRMPKSVSVAVGRLLWQQRRLGAHNRPEPFWKYFVPLVWSETDRAFRYLRVDYAQPTVSDLGISS